MEGDSLEQDRRFAEWYVWAKREVGTDNRVCLGAAQAAIEALVDGGDEQAARQAARGSVAGHGVALLTRIAPRRKAYAEWYDWARRELGGGRERQHVAAAAALERLDAGDDAGHAAAAARTAVSDVPAQAPAYPPGPTVATAPPGPPAPSSAASGSAASGAPPAPDLPPAPTGPASSTAPLLPPPIVAPDARATETAAHSPTTGVLHAP
ncbi:MAG TPA: hypothetical protein VOB72_01780, partial [Candidatus Dormibacteraeota bacterium]|nr:hypothetical protein [Candidatus Dormibacteraeota bacterium]